MDKSIENMFSLEGRTALITGAGSGIGKGIAEFFSKAGASIFAVDIDEERLLSLKDKIERDGGSYGCFQCDLREEEKCKAMVEACIRRFSHLDIVVACAGTRGVHGDLDKEFDTDNFTMTMDVDFKSVFMTVKYAYPECARGGKGSIITIASLAALAARGPIVYSAAKGAVRSFSRTLAKRLGSFSVRVNTIYPGFIVTEMTKKIHQMPELEEKEKSESPLHLLGTPEDIAACALYLASDASRFVTGADFVIDGGAIC